MKTKSFVLIIVISIVLNCALALFCFVNNYFPKQNNDFEYMEISEYLSCPPDKVPEYLFDKDINQDCITNASTALIMGKALIADWFDMAEVKDHEPFEIFFSEREQAWIVSGTLKQPLFGIRLGGVPYVIIDKKTGAVLRISHSR